MLPPWPEPKPKQATTTLLGFALLGMLALWIAEAWVFYMAFTVGRPWVEIASFSTGWGLRGFFERQRKE